MPCRWVQDDGMRFLYVDYSRVLREEYLACLADSVRRIEAEPQGALMLIEIAHIPTNSAFLSAVKRANHDVFGPRQTRKVYLGADDLHRSIVHGLTLVAPSVQGLVFSDRTAAVTALRSSQRKALSIGTAAPGDAVPASPGSECEVGRQVAGSGAPRRPHRCPDPRTVAEWGPGG